LDSGRVVEIIDWLLCYGVLINMYSHWIKDFSVHWRFFPPEIS